MTCRSAGRAARLVLCSAVLMGTAGGADAQSANPAARTVAPFDMSQERPTDVVPAVGEEAGAPPSTVEVDNAATGDAPEPVPAAQTSRRFLLPAGETTLSGEESRRAWSVYVTAAEAAAPASLNIGFENALVVAPEFSTLSVALNGTNLLTAPLDAASGVKRVRVELPAGSLMPGWNDLQLSASQRHRTDCSVPSTYELWTRVDAGATFLEFGAAPKLSSIDDIRAVGADEEGKTRFRFVVPALGGNAANKATVRLSQALALMTGMPNQTVAVAGGPPAPDTSAAEPAFALRSSPVTRTPGTLNVLLGTVAELGALLPVLPQGSASGPVVTFVDTPALGPSTLVVTGPDWNAVAAGVEGMLAPLDRGRDIQRSVFASKPWRVPEAPMLFGAATVGFGELGVPTQEFSGRRFRTDFAVAVPSDFYAQAYGEAGVLLDAAYDKDVEPGSHIDIYVNGFIASTMPITSPGGAILRHMPIKVPMRHFRPGLNTVALEAVLMTAADTVCAPGATATKANRFVLFDTSEWLMPDFARIAQLPNLAALSGTAAPYGRSPQPVSLAVDRREPEASVSAAATILARMAVTAGRPVDVDLSLSASAAGGRNALFVAPIAEVAPEILAQVGVAASGRTGWNEAAPAVEGEAPDNTADTFARWKTQLNNGSWHGRVGQLGDWMEHTFGVSADSLKFGADREAPFVPGGDASLMIAQGPSPDGTATWTVVAAPTASLLKQGAGAIATQANWTALDGRITTYNGATERLASVPVGQQRLSGAEPASLANYRLILANWLSANVIVYSLTLGGLAVMLGLSTTWLLSSLGRRQ